MMEVQVDTSAPLDAPIATTDRCDGDREAALSCVDAVQQWPSSLRLERELREGLRQSAEAPWRWLFASGEVYEVTGCVVVSATRTVVDDHTGRQWEKPLRATATFSTQAMVRVDPVTPVRRRAPLRM